MQHRREACLLRHLVSSIPSLLQLLQQQVWLLVLLQLQQSLLLLAMQVRLMLKLGLLLKLGLQGLLMLLLPLLLLQLCQVLLQLRRLHWGPCLRKLLHLLQLQIVLAQVVAVRPVGGEPTRLCGSRPAEQIVQG